EILNYMCYRYNFGYALWCRRFGVAIPKLAVALTTVIAALIIGLPACAEMIRSYAADVRLNKDCSLNITETILMDFEDAQRHGIYRVIPVQYSRFGANFTTELKIKAITDESGLPYKYEGVRQGPDVNIKIGDAGITMSGPHTYVLHYVVNRAV